ncbi:hypothetical protein [Bradyrhizobium sp. STM 3809]|uniref:hypothetical protein n=1 Tax=Bradyrhizobium sp. STM 3809 TaxID=551936 RepID=UPI00024075ED|nr:hypothetical protein [Bradyrhizobium sp. STM 3809]CCD97735.1 hypothetical protein BRAS3809_130002 [Bradyrhizobium sp. STM 3809]
MNVLFSVNRAAHLLERDRATLVRALKHVPPDGFEHGQPRWLMPTITAALARPPGERRETAKYRDRFSIGRSKALDGLRTIFEQKIALITAEPNPERRRPMAFALAPVICDYQRSYLDFGRSLGIADEDVLGHRADLIIEEMVSEVAEAAGRSADRAFFAEMIEAMAVEAE